VSKQSDALYKSYQELSKTGSVGAGGMAEVFDSMQKFGYAVNELSEMQALLARNAEALADFSGTAVQGARAISDVAQDLQRGDVGKKFRNMGLSVDDINQNIAGFIRREVSLGRNRTDIDRNLNRETQRYIEQVVAVQRLTGQTREQLEEKQAEAQREQAFAFTQFELRKRMNSADAAERAEATKEYQKNEMLNRVLQGKTRQQFLASLGGDVSEAGDLIRSAPEAFGKMLAGSGASAAEVIDTLNREFGTTIETLGPLAKFNAFNDFLIPIDEQLKLQSKYGTKSFELLMKDAEANSVALDDATQSQTSLRMAQMNARQATENLVNAGINPVTKAMQILAEAVEYLTNLLPFSGRAKERYEQQQTEKVAQSAAKLTGTVLDKIIQVESGNRNIGNQSGAGGKATSSAYGVAQMTKGTFENLAKNASATSPLYGKTFEDMKQDVGLQREAASMLTVQNQDRLTKEGIQTTDANTYLAHFLGASGAVKVLKAPDTAPIESVVSGNQIYANQSVFKNIATAGDLKAWARKKMGEEISGAFGWSGVISGPSSGYKPNITMHGTEKLSIRPTTSNDYENSSLQNISAEMLEKLIDRVDDLIYVSKNQLSTSEKMLKYQQ
jgi:hypothetical protein